MISMTSEEVEAVASLVILSVSFVQCIYMFLSSVQAHREGLIGYHGIKDGITATAVYGAIFILFIFVVSMFSYIVVATW